ncbi:MAG: SDR family NAD(P)-dependent oxidoreductase [Nitrospirae bacterium]|nr:SDR family NAD(P)-dependent oxidoreductase [Nitrospirota bacterium]
MSVRSANWTNRKVLVTGAGGFIGSHLVERLVELGARTRAFIRYNSANSWGCLDESDVKDDVEVFPGDLRDRDSLRPAMKGVDVLFHLGALIAIPYSYRAPASYLHTNVEGSLNVFQTALDSGVGRVVHTSTSEVYGTARYCPIDEEHPLQGWSPYSASKIAADKLAEAFHRSFGLPVATIRPFNTFGPRQSARAVIPTIVTQALAAKEIRLGSLTPRRDFNFVADTVEGFIRMADSNPAVGEVINIGSGRDISIGEVAGSVLKILKKDVPINSENARVRPTASEVAQLCAENGKAKSLLGWEPRFSFEAGLACTIEWVERNMARYRIGTYAI